MKVKNMTGKMGNPVANQFSIHDDYGNHYFQSYDSIPPQNHYDYQSTTQPPYW